MERNRSLLTFKKLTCPHFIVLFACSPPSTQNIESRHRLPLQPVNLLCRKQNKTGEGAIRAVELCVLSVGKSILRSQ